MNLQELKNLGGFIKADELVKKTITFRMTDDGEEVSTEIFVRRMSIGAHEKVWGPEKKDVSRTAKMLSEAIRLGENGEEHMSYEDAYRLHPNIATAMATAIADVNGGGRKNSIPSSASDTE